MLSPDVRSAVIVESPAVSLGAPKLRDMSHCGMREQKDASNVNRLRTALRYRDGYGLDWPVSPLSVHAAEAARSLTLERGARRSFCGGTDWAFRGASP